MRPAVCAVVALALCAAAPTAARAQDCTDAGVDPSLVGTVLDTFPASMDSMVARDVVVRVRFVVRAPPDLVVGVEGPTVSGSGQVPGSATTTGDELVWQPNEALQPYSGYGVHVTSDGSPVVDFSFTTGALTTDPMDFAGITSADFVRNSGSDVCGDPNSVNVTVRFDAATDPTLSEQAWQPMDDVEYVVYETRGPGIAGPVERARQRGAPRGTTGDLSQLVSFRMGSADITGPLCFSVQAVTPGGHLATGTTGAEGNTEERCIDPSRGNFFAGCDARPDEHTPGGRTPWGPLGVALAAATATALAVSRRRR